MINRIHSLFLISAAILATAPLPAAWGGADGYNPGQSYAGKYTVDVIYYRNRNNPNWYQGLNGTYPKNVLCMDALKHFSTDGKWSGHFKIDGSCGPTTEPSEFAVGNRLNFDDSQKAVR